MTERYKEYLQSAEWEYIKKLKFKQNGYVCNGCGNTRNKLEVHHNTYERIGMELLTDLYVLCSSCHENIHGKTPETKWNKYITNKTDEKPQKRLLQDIELDILINSI